MKQAAAGFERKVDRVLGFQIVSLCPTEGLSLVFLCWFLLTEAFTPTLVKQIVIYVIRQGLAAINFEQNILEIISRILLFGKLNKFV